MYNVNLLIKELQDKTAFNVSVNDPFLQFELDSKELLFSSLLPERRVQQNSYRDTGVRFKTMIANDSTRYSPPQKKQGMLVSSVMVELGDSDVGAELSMQAYEEFIKFINSGLSQNAVAQLIRLFENSISMPLALLRERHRAEVFTQGYVTRKGANSFEEVVKFSQPAGHRVTVLSASNPATDILGTLKAKRLLLEGKGFNVTRLITTKQVLNDYLIPNTAINAYGLETIVQPGGTFGSRPNGISEVQRVINALAAYDLPQPTLYEHGYSDQDNGYTRFVQDKIILVCETGRSQDVDLGNNANPIIIPNTLGYTGIGIATGQLAPGIATKVEAFDGKDARIEATGWQTTFPVLQDPEAFAVITLSA